MGGGLDHLAGDGALQDGLVEYKAYIDLAGRIDMVGGGNYVRGRVVIILVHAWI